jgi:hypothetical protein
VSVLGENSFCEIKRLLKVLSKTKGANMAKKRRLVCCCFLLVTVSAFSQMKWGQLEYRENLSEKQFQQKYRKQIQDFIKRGLELGRRVRGIDKLPNTVVKDVNDRLADYDCAVGDVFLYNCQYNYELFIVRLQITTSGWIFYAESETH